MSQRQPFGDSVLRIWQQLQKQEKAEETGDNAAGLIKRGDKPKKPGAQSVKPTEPPRNVEKSKKTIAAIQSAIALRVRNDLDNCEIDLNWSLAPYREKMEASSKIIKESKDNMDFAIDLVKKETSKTDQSAWETWKKQIDDMSPQARMEALDELRREQKEFTRNEANKPMNVAKDLYLPSLVNADRQQVKLNEARKEAKPIVDEFYDLMQANANQQTARLKSIDTPGTSGLQTIWKNAIEQRKSQMYESLQLGSAIPEAQKDQRVTQQAQIGEPAPTQPRRR